MRIILVSGEVDVRNEANFSPQRGRDAEKEKNRTREESAEKFFFNFSASLRLRGNSGERGE
jgi:hypothetical protein